MGRAPDAGQLSKPSPRPAVLEDPPAGALLGALAAPLVAAGRDNVPSCKRTRRQLTARGRRVPVTVTRYERTTVVEIAAAEKSYELRESIALEADETVTTVSITMGFEPTATWARLVAPLFRPLQGSRARQQHPAVAACTQTNGGSRPKALAAHSDRGGS